MFFHRGTIACLGSLGLLLVGASWTWAEGLADELNLPPTPPWQTPAAEASAPPLRAEVPAEPIRQQVAARQPRSVDMLGGVGDFVEAGSDYEIATADQQFSPEQEARRQRIQKVLATYYPRKLNTRDHSTWEIMHSIVAYGVHSEVLRDGPQGEPVSGIGWLCYNGHCRGGKILMLERNSVAARRGVDVQGHHGQLLAILAQSRLRPDYPMHVDGREFTIADLIESEKIGCEPNTELTFKLISLMHYLPSDAVWKSYAGQTWTIPRLIQEEIKAPIRGAACGGTHRLMGLAYAVQKRKLRDEPIDGEFLRAQRYLDEYHKYTYALQNRDGSFSTEWFKGRGDRNDIDRRLQTTGHILEWLSFSLPDDQLDDPRLERAVDYLSNLLLSYPDHSWELGPLGHGVHALVIYNERKFGQIGFQPPVLESNLAVAESEESAVAGRSEAGNAGAGLPTAGYPDTGAAALSVESLPQVANQGVQASEAARPAEAATEAETKAPAAATAADSRAGRRASR